MSKTINQRIVFKNTTPSALYELYMNARKHSLATGATAKISAKPGSRFSVYDGYAIGRNLLLEKDRLIVQTWRAADWSKSDEDSVFMILLEPKGKDTILQAIHANLPDKHAEGLKKGWFEFYWEPWKKHLTGKKIKKPAVM